MLLGMASCKTIKQYTGNPEPNMKSVHMASFHWNYTQEEYDAHPDHDCTIKQIKNER